MTARLGRLAHDQEQVGLAGQRYPGLAAADAPAAAGAVGAGGDGGGVGAGVGLGQREAAQRIAAREPLRPAGCEAGLLRPGDCRSHRIVHREREGEGSIAPAQLFEHLHRLWEAKPETANRRGAEETG
jgi:hypothetical protein